MKRKLFLAIAFLLTAALLFSLAACELTGSGTSKEEGTSNATSSPSQTTSGKVGETISNGKWKLTLKEAKTYTEIKSEYFTDTPDEGKVYLALFFEAENISAEDDYFNYLYGDSYVDSYSVNSEILLSDIDGQKTMAGNIAAGKKLIGYLVWAVPEDWSEFEFNYNDDFWGNEGIEKLTFKINFDEATKVVADTSELASVEE